MVLCAFMESTPAFASSSARNAPTTSSPSRQIILSTGVVVSYLTDSSLAILAASAHLVFIVVISR